MAFGMEIFAKLFLTLFRIAAVTVIGWFLYKFGSNGNGRRRARAGTFGLWDNLFSWYLDFAERQAEREQVMTMSIGQSIWIVSLQ